MNYNLKTIADIERVLFAHLVKRIGIQIPTNFDEIVEYVHMDMLHNRKKRRWDKTDVILGFRRWIESKG